MPNPMSGSHLALGDHFGNKNLSRIIQKIFFRPGYAEAHVLIAGNLHGMTGRELCARLKEVIQNI